MSAGKLGLAGLVLAFSLAGCAWKVNGTGEMDCLARGCHWVPQQGGCWCEQGKGGLPQGMQTKP